MRLLHVYSGNMYGGIEAMLHTIATGQTASLESEVALCFDGRLGRELQAAGVRVHRLPEVRVSRPHTVRRGRQALRTIVREGDFDRVICHAAWPHAVFGRAVRDSHVPLVLWVHDAMTGRSWTERWAQRTAPDLAICNSHFTAATLGTLYRNVPAAVVYPPVPVPRLSTSAADRTAIRRELDTPADAIVVVQASRAEPWKGHRALLEALTLLRDVPNWVWWIVGGAQRRGEHGFIETLQAAAHRAGVGDRVRLAGQRANVQQLLAAADVYAQANIRPEPFGVAFVEALAAGLPVVTISMGGAMEILDRSCGILVPPADVRALADALRLLIVDPARRRDLASAARTRARQIADPVRQLRVLADVLTAMTARGRVS